MFINLKTIRHKFLKLFWCVFDNVVYPFSNTGVIIAVSGGLDSRLLLEVVSQYPKRIEGNYVVTSINHQSRKISIKECILVFNRAKILGFNAELVNINNRYAFLAKNEKELRSYRYNILWSIKRFYKCSSILTAHTKSDIIESYIMYILGWGGGHLGSSIPILRKTDLGYILRPFINLTRYQIEGALFFLDVFNYFQDFSNLQDIYKRSFVRNNVLRFLYKYDKNSLERIYYVSQYSHSIKNYFDKKNFILCKKKIIIPIYVKIPKFIMKKIVIKIMNSLHFIDNQNMYKNAFNNILNSSYELKASSIYFNHTRYKKINVGNINIKILSKSLIFEEI